MEVPGGGFDSRHSDHVNNTEVLLALLTQNKELEGWFFPLQCNQYFNFLSY